MSHPLPVPSYKSVLSPLKAIPDICTQGSLDDANVQQGGSTIVLSFNAGAGLPPQLTLLNALASAPGFSSYQIIERPCFLLAIAHHHYITWEMYKILVLGSYFRVAGPVGLNILSRTRVHRPPSTSVCLQPGLDRAEFKMHLSSCRPGAGPECATQQS